jgi:lipoprotein-releasing system permease protein
VDREEPKEDALARMARAQDRVREAEQLQRRGRVELGAGTALIAGGLLAWAIIGNEIWGVFLGPIPLSILMLGAVFMLGLALVASGTARLLGGIPGEAELDAGLVLAIHRRRVIGGLLELGIGVVGIIASVVLAWTHKHALGTAVQPYVMVYAPLVVGYAAAVRGVLHLMRADDGLIKPTRDAGRRHDLSVGIGFKTFVAWRYLMARHHRISRIVLFVFFIALFVAGASLMMWFTIDLLAFSRELAANLRTTMLVAMIAGFVLLYFSILIGLLRYVYSFFTTVPLTGVLIGTGALVCVLAVMSGFETDLRQKILGSNAHIQVTREEGEFTNWREIKAKIDKLPGVVASSPYAVSEVVIAANNNGMNVIIKGIDVDTVGKVTDLIDDLKDKDAIKRLEPLVEDTRDLTVPDKPQPGGKVVDPPPDDMPGAGDPIDFSQPAEGSADLLDPSLPPPIDDPPPIGDVGTMKVTPYGGEAVAVQPPGVDPPPADLVTTDEEPQDFSGSSDDDDIDDDTIHVIDVPMEPLSRRTQSLPGVLVGQELQKQTHLYVGEEVRIVSPLSDPANPDATGTPIPFNRDYRVAGIFFTGMYEYDLKYVYVTIDSLTDFLDRGDVVDGIEVRIGNADDTDEYVGRLKHLLGPQYRIQDWKELNRSLFSALKLEKIAMFLVLGIVILVASFSIVGNLIMVVVEKAREIALIKTLGASDISVMLVFAIQGLMIGVIGTMLGLGTGLLACWFGKEYGIPLNPDVYYIDRMPVHVDPTSVLVTGAAGVLISMLATFYPALVAARVRPAAGMRH